MADYLCNPKCAEVPFIPSTVNVDQAMRNVESLHLLFSRLILEKDFVALLRPEIKEFEPYLSGSALPDLLSRYSYSLTLLEFLNESTDFVRDMRKDLKLALLPLVDIFRDSQLSQAFDRLNNLTKMLEDGVVDY